MNQKMEMLLWGRQFKRLKEQRFSSIRKKYGLKQIEVEILAFMLQNSDSVTSTDIRSILMLNKGQISQAMDALYQKGYLKSSVDKEDRRLILFDLTDQAQEIAEEISAVREELRQRIWEGIPEEEVAQFRSTACKILANINSLAEAEL